MQGFIPELLDVMYWGGQMAILMIDQSKVCDHFECLMVSVRVGERALPIIWKVVETKGSIGFAEQKVLLEEVAKMIPQGMKVLLAADRFYGTAALIALCKRLGWQCRIRP